MTQRVEYKVITALPDVELEEELNAAAAEGWRLTHVVPPPTFSSSRSTIVAAWTKLILERAPERRSVYED